MTKNALQGLGIGVAALLIAGHAAAADEVVWVNDWIPGGDKATVYVGVHKGFFAEEGLDVKILPGRGSADAVTKIATGVAEIGTTGISALMQAAAQGTMPVKAILSIYTKQPDSIFTTTDTGINTLANVTGKTVATAPFSSSNVVWPLVLKANGIKESEITLLKVEPATLAPMLAAGKVAASVSWVTNVPLYEKALATVGKTLKVIPWFDYGFHGYAYTLIASDRFLKERKDVARRFVRAYRKSLAAGLADPKVAAASLKALVPETDFAVAEGQWRASIPLIVNDISKKHGLGNFDGALLQETWSWVAKSINVSPDRLNPEVVVDRSLLQ